MHKRRLDLPLEELDEPTCVCVCVCARARVMLGMRKRRLDLLLEALDDAHEEAGLAIDGCKVGLAVLRHHLL
jgi:hypothetical protein